MIEHPFADYLKPLVLLSLNTGARQGELFRLHWNDIDFDRKSMALVMRGKRKSLRHLPIASYFVDTSMQRVDEPFLPPKAIREAVINAITHRGKVPPSIPLLVCNLHVNSEIPLIYTSN